MCSKADPPGLERLALRVSSPPGLRPHKTGDRQSVCPRRTQVGAALAGRSACSSQFFPNQLQSGSLIAELTGGSANGSLGAQGYGLATVATQAQCALPTGRGRTS